jgi:thioesterase domain-containing protein
MVFRELFSVPALQRPAFLWRIATAPFRSLYRSAYVAKLPSNVKRVRKACLQAAKHYMPQSYSGRVILFRSNHKPLGQSIDPRAGWSTYAAEGLEIHEIEGNHENILLEPQVRYVARQLRTCLDEVPVAGYADQVIPGQVMADRAMKDAELSLANRSPVEETV